jgi:hypothetical protein
VSLQNGKSVTSCIGAKAKIGRCGVKISVNCVLN